MARIKIGDYVGVKNHLSDAGRHEFLLGKIIAYDAPTNCWLVVFEALNRSSWLQRKEIFAAKTLGLLYGAS